MKNNFTCVLSSLLWAVLILIFPVISGTLVSILKLDSVKSLFLQGGFMVLSLVPVFISVLLKKWKWREIGFGKSDFDISKKKLYLISLIFIYIPVAIQGFYYRSVPYVLGNMFLYLFVGIAEEIYFRGIIPHILSKKFSLKAAMTISIFIFGLCHAASAFTSPNWLVVIFNILNALIFGWLAIEITVLCGNIIPAIIVHFMFDFETKIVAMDGNMLFAAEIVRGGIMCIVAVIFTIAVVKNKKTTNK